MDARTKYLAYIPCVTASLSLIGSFLTLLTIHRARYRNRASNGSRGGRRRTSLRTYQRLLVGISLSDILLSISFALGPFPAPYSPSTPWGRGTIGTCTFQGAFLQFGSASYAYSLMLMIYYILVIRCNRSNAWIARRAEPIMHAIPIAFFGGTAIAGIVYQVFNPSRLRCWVGVYPADCLSNPQVPCQRGEDYYVLFGAWLLLIPLMVINALLVLALALIAWTVWQQHALTQSFVVGRRSRVQTKQVIVQCFLYALAFINAMVWSTTGSLLSIAQIEYDDLGKHFWIAVLSVTFFPLQGFFNFLVFIRPRFLQKRRTRGGGASRFAALRNAVWNPSVQEELSLSSRTRRRRAVVLRGTLEISRSGTRSKSSPRRQQDPSSHDEKGEDPEALSTAGISGQSSERDGDLEAGQGSSRTDSLEPS